MPDFSTEIDIDPSEYVDNCSPKEIAELVAAEVGYKGSLEFDTTKPDGTPRKLMDNTKINNLGWKYTIELKYGIRKTIQEFDNLAK